MCFSLLMKRNMTFAKERKRKRSSLSGSSLEKYRFAECYLLCMISAWAAASLAIGTLKGEQET